MDSEVKFLSTEYARPIPRDEHPFPLMLSDITFQINGKEIYHLEFQINNDKTISIRMLEYDFQIGLQHSSSLQEYPYLLEVQFPHSAVIYPTGTSSLPGHLECRLKFQDGSSHDYRVPVVKISDYKLSELFQKHLYMFLPFSLLRFRTQLESLSRKKSRKGDKNRIKKELTAFLRELILGLETEFKQGMLSETQYFEYIRLVEAAVNHVLQKYPDIQKEANKVTECKLTFLCDIFEEHEKLLAQKDTEISQKDTEISKKDTEIAQKDTEISKKDTEIAQKDAEIARLQKELAQLKQ